jgi:acetyl esterase
MKSTDRVEGDISNIAATKKKGIFTRSILNHRELVARAEPIGKPANVMSFDILVPSSSGVQIPVEMYIPRKEVAVANLATLFYIPGTAFTAFETRFTRIICSHICNIAPCRVIVINHRLAPENPAPTAYLDCYEVFKLFLENQIISGHGAIDQNKIAFAGYSSGGNIAALMAIQAKKDNIPILTQVLISPIVDLSRSLKQFLQYEQQDTDISEEFVQWFLKLCLPGDRDPKDPIISPFWASKKEVTDLPPTTIVVAEYDRFRSDAEMYYKELSDTGVDVQKFCKDKDEHIYRWHNLEVVEKIANTILKPIFYGNPKIFGTTQNNIVNIQSTDKQNLVKVSETESTDADLQGKFFRAKL